MNIKWIGSPNFDNQRKPVDRIIIHWIVGNIAAADAQFQKTDPGTSAHYAVEDDQIHQYVKEEDVAYHAGVYAMNQRSVGIEHSAAPDRPASDKTYETSGRLIGEICKRLNIPIDREHILKHSEVKATQCPGTMDLDRLIRIAKNVGPTVVVDAKVYEHLVSGATTRKEVAEYLNISDPDNASTDSITRVVAGFKSRITDLQNQLVEAQTEVANREEQVGRLKTQLTDTQQQVRAVQEQLTKTVAEYEGKIKTKQAELDQVYRDKGELAKKLAQCQQSPVDPTPNLLAQLIEFLKNIFKK